MRNVLKDSITSLSRDASAITKSLRSDYRAGRMPFHAAANRTKFWDNDIEAAIELALEEQERNPTAKSLELLGEYHINAGRNVIARALLNDCYRQFGQLHITNIIFCQIPATVALVDDDKKILYVALPKCASSTIKNYFTFAKFGQTYGEQVHFNHGDMYRIVTAEDLATRYHDYYKFTVVRDPVSRLVSYFSSNISNKALRREAHGQQEFMGLTTTPGPVVMAQRFTQYRQFFIDFRHHTDPMTGYLRDMQPHMTEICKMSDLPRIRERLSEAYGVAIPDERSMTTKDNFALLDICKREFGNLRDFYADDYNAFF